MDSNYVLCFCRKLYVHKNEGAFIEGNTIHFIDEPCHFVNTESKDAKMQEIEYIDVVRRPFAVKAVEITEDNIAELARYIGDLQTDDDGKQYILVDHRKVPSVKKVYVGFMMTRMGSQVRVYAKRIYNEQFMDLTPSVKEWLDFLEKEAENA